MRLSWGMCPPWTLFGAGRVLRVAPVSMRTSFAALLLMLVLSMEEACGGRVKNALFGGMFSGSRKIDGDIHTDADQAELIAFLKENGFGKYATPAYIAKLDDVLAYDSIEDCTHLVADDEYSEIDMDRDDALQIQKAARREMLKRFLAAVPLPPGKEANFYGQHLDALIRAGYDEPDDVADLEEDEATLIGIPAEHLKTLVNYAEEYEMRELLHIIIVTHTDHKGATPYTNEATWRPMVEALVKAGVRSLGDIALKSDVPGLSSEDLQRIQNDPRVLQHSQKQEL